VNALLPERRGPILDLLVRRRMHVLPKVPDVVSACVKQLSRTALADFAAAQAARELRPPDSDLGTLEVLPREILVKVLSYLDLVSLAHVGATCSRLYQLAQDPFLYTVVDLRQIFFTASSATLR
jgi:F-box-like